MAEKGKKTSTSKRKKSITLKKSKKRYRNKRQHFENYDFPYTATEYDCQLCEFYGGHYEDGSIRFLAKSCDMLKDFDDFPTDEGDNNDVNESKENDDYNYWEDEDNDLADLFI